MAELTAGAKIAGKYTLVGRVGRGGMGDVWIARNEATGAEVAMKTLRPDRRTLEQSEERFRHEARVGAKLHHPNVARVYDLVEAEDGSLLLIMEKIQGDSLRKLIQDKPLPPEALLEVILPILDALGAAHRAGIIHRDVTPGNILLSEERGQIVPKLIDFGVAKTDDQIVTTQSGHALGTPQYMAPEHIRSHELDGRADLYSLAVTMYEAMTGTNPFKRANASGSLAAVLEVEVDPDPAIPPELWLVLSRALSKQPYERHSSAAEMAAALRGAMKLEPSPPISQRTSAPSIMSQDIDVKPQRTPSLIWVAVASGFILLGIVVAGLSITYKKEPVVAPAQLQTATIAPPPPASSPAVETVTPPSSASTHAPSKTTPTKPPKTRPTGKPVATTPGF